MTATELTPFVITEPGVYNIPADAYHADPVPSGSLSSTGARKLTPPDGCPARFKYDMGRVERKREFNFGQLAHLQILGVGPEIVVIDADNFKKKDAQIARDEAYMDGKIPVLPFEMDIVYDMERAILAHPWASKLFEPGTGEPEQSLFWEDQGIWRRARFDFLSYRRHPRTQQLIIPDYKTTSRSAQKDRFMRAVLDHGYHQQGAWYVDAPAGAGLIDKDNDRDPMFVFVVQETKPPYIVNVIELDYDAIGWGRALNNRAIEIYRECRANNHWPGYSEDIQRTPAIPNYLQQQYEEHLDD